MKTITSEFEPIVVKNESAKFWLSVLNDLKNRGVQDILITCVDNLTGFSQAITACYPKTEIQKCIIHQIRNSTRYVSYKDLKKVTADLKPIYKASTEEMAFQLGRAGDILQVSGGDPQADLHDEYDRELPPPATQSNQRQKHLPDR